MPPAAPFAELLHAGHDGEARYVELAFEAEDGRTVAIRLSADAAQPALALFARAVADLKAQQARERLERPTISGPLPMLGTHVVDLAQYRRRR